MMMWHMTESYRNTHFCGSLDLQRGCKQGSGTIVLLAVSLLNKHVSWRPLRDTDPNCKNAHAALTKSNRHFQPAQVRRICPLPLWYSCSHWPGLICFSATYAQSLHYEVLKQKALWNPQEDVSWNITDTTDALKTVNWKEEPATNKNTTIMMDFKWICERISVSRHVLVYFHKSTLWLFIVKLYTKVIWTM